VSAVEALALGGVLAGALCHSATGFGFALVAAPLVVAARPPAEAVGIVLLLALEVNVLTLATEGRTPRPRREDVAMLLLWGAPGVLAGVAILDGLSPTALQIAVTVTVVATLATRRLAGEPGEGVAARRWRPLAGASAGALTTTTTANGPPLVLYLLARRASPAEIRDSLGVLFIGFSVLALPSLLLLQGEAAIADRQALAAAAIVAALGQVLGRPLFRRLADGRYEPVLSALLLASSTVGLATRLA
jgi:hypothetical protein